MTNYKGARMIAYMRGEIEINPDRNRQRSPFRGRGWKK